MAEPAEFTDREKRIWDAAFAAAYAADVHAFIEIGADLERALKATNAEKATYIADQAVRELRRWRMNDSHQAGERFQPHSDDEYVGEPFRG